MPKSDVQTAFYLCCLHRSAQNAVQHFMAVITCLATTMLHRFAIRNYSLKLGNNLSWKKWQHFRLTTWTNLTFGTQCWVASIFLPCKGHSFNRNLFSFISLNRACSMIPIPMSACLFSKPMQDLALRKNTLFWIFTKLCRLSGRQAYGW